MGGPPPKFSSRSGTRSSIFLGLPASWIPWGSSFPCLRGEVAAPEAREVAAPTEASVTEPPETSVPAPTETSLPVGTEVGGTTAEEWKEGEWDSTRWAPTSYKWSYNPYKWPYKWVSWGYFTLLIEVVTLLITGRGPPCREGWVI